ncbi:MAG: hypothetical protein LBU32_31255 [Clostridiales bacterium]|nr:hypothetical protein [Clostridiales bacterium]
MKEGWPPDAVAGRAKLEGTPALFAKTPCKCIDLGLMPIKNIDLALKVRRKPKSKKAPPKQEGFGGGCRRAA